jgi:MFS family permease
MTDADSVSAEAEPPQPTWRDLYRDGRAIFSLLVFLGAALYALQILVIAIIMPTVVADIGGAEVYTWAALLYTVGAIVGSASVGPVWSLLGRRRGCVAGALVLLAGTIGCGLAPDMAWLVVARAVQGFAAGLVVGGTMALVRALFEPGLRTRVLALYQGTWMVAQLLGPVVGGVFAEIGWWRGSFWSMVPIIVVFAVLAWFKLPDAESAADTDGRNTRLPVLRLTLLSSGVMCVALAGPVDSVAGRIVLIATGIALVGLTFRLDRQAENRLYPARAVSLVGPVGLALWILFVVGMVQTSVTLFLPLLLQVVHGVSPLFVSFVSMTVSAGWTVGTFVVTGWTGARERLALGIGPALMLAGVAGVTLTAQWPGLVVLTLAAFILGFGIGTHNVHLIARTMAAATKGEEGITSSAMPSFRGLGTAFGAAGSGMLATAAGLGDAAVAGAVAPAITTVYGALLIPMAFAVFFMIRFVRIRA